jgi:hypothetical protein
VRDELTSLDFVSGRSRSQRPAPRGLAGSSPSPASQVPPSPNICSPTDLQISNLPFRWRTIGYSRVYEAQNRGIRNS